eukprot:EG_transcript_9580
MAAPPPGSLSPPPAHLLPPRPREDPPSSDDEGCCAPLIHGPCPHACIPCPPHLLARLPSPGAANGHGSPPPIPRPYPSRVECRMRERLRHPRSFPDPEPSAEGQEWPPPPPPASPYTAGPPVGGTPALPPELLRRDPAAATSSSSSSSWPPPPPARPAAPSPPPQRPTPSTPAPPATPQDLTEELVAQTLEVEDPNADDRREFVAEFGEFCERELRLAGCKAFAYGSSATGLCAKGSDVDIYLMVKTDMLKSEAKRVLGKLERVLKKQGLREVTFIEDARVPVVQTRVRQPQGMWRYSFDVNAMDATGFLASRVVAGLVAKDPRVRLLALPLKQLLARTHLNNAKQGYLCTYGWVLCLLAFLQSRRPPVLPTEAGLQAFTSANTEMVGELFPDFFRWMALLDWKNMYVSARSGGVHHRGAFPGDFQHGRCMVIEDIYQQGVNITKLRSPALRNIVAWCQDIADRLGRTNAYRPLLTLDYGAYRKRPRPEEDAGEEEEEVGWEA